MHKKFVKGKKKKLNVNAGYVVNFVRLKLNKSSVTFDVSCCVCAFRYVTMWIVRHDSETFLLFFSPQKRGVGAIITCCLAATGEFAALFGTSLINKGDE